jgi:hypothetical protein
MNENSMLKSKLSEVTDKLIEAENLGERAEIKVRKMSEALLLDELIPAPDNFDSDQLMKPESEEMKGLPKNENEMTIFY